MQRAARRELAREQRRHVRLHQPALVMTFLRPRIRKEEMDRRERRVADHLLDHFHRVVADHANIGQALAFDSIEQRPDARAMHLDGDKVRVRMCFRDRHGGFAHPGANLEHERCAARRRDRGLREREAVAGVELVERTLLRRRRPALPQNVAADRPVQAALDEIFPSVGELGEAE
jgi:hypothetical protein